MEEFIRRNAELVIKEIRNLFGVILSYDEESVAWLDKYILQIRGNLSPEDTRSLVDVLGSFFGECIRRRFGGQWRLTGEQWAIVFDDRNVIFPFSKMSKYFQSDGESILGLYKTIPLVFKRAPKNNVIAPADASVTVPQMDDLQVQEVASLLDLLRSQEYMSRKHRCKGDAWYESGNHRFSMEYHNLAAQEERSARAIRTRLEEMLGAAGNIPAPDPQEMLSIRTKAQALPAPWSDEENDFDKACFCARYPRWTRLIPELWCAWEKWKDDPRFLQEAPRFMPVNLAWEP